MAGEAWIASRPVSAAGVGVNAAAFAFGSARLLGVPAVGLVCALAFAAAFLSYALDRTIDPSPGSSRHTRSLFVALGVWVVVAGYVAFRASWLAALHSLVFPISVVAYSYPWMNVRLGSRRVRRIKEVPLMKPFYVAAMWTQLPVIAMLFAPRVSYAPLILISSWTFVKATINAVTCDLDDVEDDRARGVLTWPVLLGRARIRYLLHVLNAMGALPLIVAAGYGLLPAKLACFELLALYFAFCLTTCTRFKVAFDLGPAVVLLPVIVLVTRG